MGTEPPSPTMGLLVRGRDRNREPMRLPWIIPTIITSVVVLLSGCGGLPGPGQEAGAIKAAQSDPTILEVLNYSPGWTSTVIYVPAKSHGEFNHYRVTFQQKGEALLVALVSGTELNSVWITSVDKAGAENLIRGKFKRDVQVEKVEVPYHIWQGSDVPIEFWLSKDKEWVALSRSIFAANISNFVSGVLDQANQRIQGASTELQKPLRLYLTAGQRALESGRPFLALDFAFQIVNETRFEKYWFTETKSHKNNILSHIQNLPQWAPARGFQLKEIGVAILDGYATSGDVAYFELPDNKILAIYYRGGGGECAAYTTSDCYRSGLSFRNLSYMEKYLLANETPPVENNYYSMILKNGTARYDLSEPYIHRARILEPDGGYTEFPATIHEVSFPMPGNPNGTSDRIITSGPFILRLYGLEEVNRARLNVTYQNRAIYSGPAQGFRFDVDGDGSGDAYLRLGDISDKGDWNSERIGTFRWIEGPEIPLLPHLHRD